MTPNAAIHLGMNVVRGSPKGWWTEGLLNAHYRSWRGVAICNVNLPGYTSSLLCPVQNRKIPSPTVTFHSNFPEGFLLLLPLLLLLFLPPYFSSPFTSRTPPFLRQQGWKEAEQLSRGRVLVEGGMVEYQEDIGWCKLRVFHIQPLGSYYHAS